MRFPSRLSPSRLSPACLGWPDSPPPGSRSGLRPRRWASLWEGRARAWWQRGFDEMRQKQTRVGRPRGLEAR